MENNKEQMHINTLLGIYKPFSSGVKAELRKLPSYHSVWERAPSAFYPIRDRYSEKWPRPFWKNSREVIAALLLLWRDRKAEEPTLRSDQKVKLGSLFVGDGKQPPIKINRFKRLMKAETLDEGFHALRTILRLFKDDDVNWGEVASLISAWKENEKKNSAPLMLCKKKLADAYYTHYNFNTNS